MPGCWRKLDTALCCRPGTSALDATFPLRWTKQNEYLVLSQLFKLNHCPRMGCRLRPRSGRKKSKILPIKVRDCRPEGLLAPLNRREGSGIARFLSLPPEVLRPAQAAARVAGHARGRGRPEATENHSGTAILQRSAISSATWIKFSLASLTPF